MRAEFYRPAKEEEQRRELAGSLNRYKSVHRAKRLLLMLGAALLFLLVIMPLFQPEHTRLPIPVVEQPAGSPAPKGSSEMLKPRFEGSDAKGQPYQIAAREARQQDADTVVLEEAQGDIMLLGEKWLAIKAGQGVMSLSKKYLELSQGIELFYEGYEGKTASASFMLEGMQISGQEPVEIQGPLGVLKAKGFKMDKESGKLLFIGPVHVTLYAKKS